MAFIAYGPDYQRGLRYARYSKVAGADNGYLTLTKTLENCALRWARLVGLLLVAILSR
jgi:hypothetical protein